MCAAVLSDGNGNADWVNSQLSVNDNELNIGEVVVGVGEVGCCKVHWIGTSISAAHFCGAAEREVGFCIQRIVNRYIVTCYGVLFTVIVMCAAVLSDGNGNADWVNLQHTRNRINIIITRHIGGVSACYGYTCNGVGFCAGVGDAAGYGGGNYVTVR